MIHRQGNCRLLLEHANKELQYRLHLGQDSVAVELKPLSGTGVVEAAERIWQVYYADVLSGDSVGTSLPDR